MSSVLQQRVEGSKGKFCSVGMGGESRHRRNIPGKKGGTGEGTGQGID
jgi:hypothetical protein